MAHDITIQYATADGFRETRHFKTLTGARRFAHKMVGEHPDFGSNYAVSFDGIGRVRIKGASFVDIFPGA